ncbi:MAG TPA: hypothetical protein VJ820_01220, partial [Propionibacteriaceae bacterium]|nr:hypothetical protein [Propionibacteriaceae bacterium]
MAWERGLGGLLIRSSRPRCWHSRVVDRRHLIGAARAVVTSSAPAAAGTAFEQVASSSDDTIAVTDPRDFAVTIPPGTGRVILDFIGYASDFNTAFVDSDIIDPGGGQQVALTEAEERKEPSGSAAAIKLYYLLDTNMPTGPTETLRYDQDNAAGNAAKWGPRQIITVHGAAQTVHHSGNQ